MSNESVEGPPEQWFMPGTLNSRARFGPLGPLRAHMASTQRGRVVGVVRRVSCTVVDDQLATARCKGRKVRRVGKAQALR